MQKAGSLYQERGAIRTGKIFGFGATMGPPSAKIEIYRNRLILKYPFGKMEFKKEEITSIQRYSFVTLIKNFPFHSGIKINHKKLKTTKFIFFFSINPDRLIDKLKDYGYTIGNPLKEKFWNVFLRLIKF